MPVPVMDVGIMRVRVGQRLVLVLVVMRLAAVPVEMMMVAMVRVVDVAVRVAHRTMGMRVRMLLGQMQPHTGAHQECGDPEDRFRHPRKQQQ